MANIGNMVTQALILGLGAFLLWIWLNSPLQPIKDAALFNLLLLGVLAVTIYAGAAKSANESIVSWFTIKSRNDFFAQAGAGVLFGLIGLFLIAFVTQAIGYLSNFFSIVNGNLLASLTVDGALFAGIINPITEVFILVGLSLALKSFIPKKWFFRGIVAIIAISLFFGAFHFYAKQQEAASQGIVFPYESSLGGVISSITDVSGISSPNYVGAFPQVLLGFFWIVLAFGYRSFIIPIFAHLVSNSTILFLSAPQNPEVSGMLLAVFVVLGLITFVSFKVGLLDKLNDFDLRAVYR